MINEKFLAESSYRDINPLIYGEESCENGHAFGPAIRTYWLLHYVHSGCGIFVINDREYKVSPGDIFVIPPYIKTYYKADDKNPWHYSWIGFTAGIGLPEAFCSAVISCADADGIFNRMRACAARRKGANAFLCSCLWELISNLQAGSRHETAGYAERAKAIIDSEYMNELTVSDIAERLLITRSYLFRVFKDTEGISPQEYLLNVRLQKAEKLIMIFDKSITDTALAVGYKDVYAFSKIFKKYFGASPKIYRKTAEK